ncbi:MULTISPECIES: DUF4194 domain-containing protein [Marinomonas]|uniref:Uncharacterized protein DUF4194 n=2 Tax=Marinomonas TaxID=28253 RepID=A0A366CYY9_9GAMM|nr:MULTISPECIES: DUF4194 domain-containing protein [Marinomonas]AEF54771.1 hypothetical protein Mar181_1733 [Marinomonas posidonica IVIA-Po-181]KZN13189.1 hypothetical protein OA79_12125 [Marinomonas sp. TW1]RBO82885.1 uncharacterized protein DUF4194 [Marinomonas aquiplantarum]
MLKELKKVVEESGKDAQEFQQTANYVIANQFASAYKHGQRKHYLLLESYQEYFDRLFDALGMKLYINENERLAGVLPVQREAFVRLKTDETLFLLVLRQIYEEKIENFEVDNGFVATNTHTILDRFVHLVKREIPSETRFKDILSLFSRHGVIIRGKTYEEDSKNQIINITPVVRLIVTEAYLRQLESFNGTDPDEDDIESDDSDVEITSETNQD